MSAWMTTNGAFDRLVRGLEVQAMVAVELLLLRGHWVRCLTDLVLADERDQATLDRFRDESDIEIGGGHLVEVKERPDLAFTGPDDFPYPTILVGRLGRWQTRTTIPCAVAVLSSTGGRLAVPCADRSRWVIEEKFDRKEDRVEISYGAPKEDAWTWQQLLDHLRAPCSEVF